MAHGHAHVQPTTPVPAAAPRNPEAHPVCCDRSNAAHTHRIAHVHHPCASWNPGCARRNRSQRRGLTHTGLNSIQARLADGWDERPHTGGCAHIHASAHPCKLPCTSCETQRPRPRRGHASARGPHPQRSRRPRPRQPRLQHACVLWPIQRCAHAPHCPCPPPVCKLEPRVRPTQP